MSDRRHRRGVPDRWLLPPPPSDPVLATRWDALGFDERRSLARVAPFDVGELTGVERELVVALARRRLATSWRLLVGAPVLGWLVLMTIWGFGRSTYPDARQQWLMAGLLLGALTWSVAAVHVARRLRRARTLVTLAEPDGV